MLGFYTILPVIHCYLRSFVKWFLRKTTRLCELQRICYGEVVGAPRTLAVEKSLLKSRRFAIRELLHLHDGKVSNYKKNLQYAIRTVIEEKQIKPQIHVQFFKSFGKCLEQIWGYKSLLEVIENLRKIPYDSNDVNHENKLMSLWQHLAPDIPLEARITKQWQDIGFQGDDPKTDFRGMGLLGLENLLYLAVEHTDVARQMLSRSQHPKQGYTFAIVGINLTYLAYHLVKDGSAKTHVYNFTRSPPSIRTFHQLYCYLFIEFDKFWIECKPSNLMDFNYVRDQFEKNIRVSLSNPKTVFRLNIVVDKI